MIVFTPETLPEETGTYTVEYSTVENRKELKTIGVVTIVDKNTIINESIAIDAQDFSVSNEENINEETVLLFSEAKAWNITTQESYEIESVEIAKVDESTYNATLYSFDNISTTIKITVRDEKLNDKMFLESKKEDFNGDIGGYLSVRNIGFLSGTFILTLYALISILWLMYNHKLNLSIRKLHAANTNVNES